MLQPMTIGELIATLRLLPREMPAKMGNRLAMAQDFGEPGCWRGSYCQFNLPPGDTPHSVGSLQDLLINKVLGHTLESRGGPYEMFEDTEVRCDKPGAVNDMAIVGIKVIDDVALLLSAFCEY